MVWNGKTLHSSKEDSWFRGYKWNLGALSCWKGDSKHYPIHRITMPPHWPVLDNHWTCLFSCQDETGFSAKRPYIEFCSCEHTVKWKATLFTLKGIPQQIKLETILILQENTYIHLDIWFLLCVLYSSLTRWYDRFGGLVVECSPHNRKTRVQIAAESYQSHFLSLIRLCGFVIRGASGLLFITYIWVHWNQWESFTIWHYCVFCSHITG